MAVDYHVRGRHCRVLRPELDEPTLNIWAHLLVLSGMVCGTLVLIQSQVGYVSPYAPKDDEEEIVTPPTPRA